MKIAVTGARGLLGWHSAARLHARVCAARYLGHQPDLELVLLDRASFDDLSGLSAKLRGVDAVLHFAGVNRGSDTAVSKGNVEIAHKLVQASSAAGVRPKIVYANSTHADANKDSAYGRSKRMAGEILADNAGSFTDLVLPHIFGECARPYYNNVTATLVDQLWNKKEPTVDPAGKVRLLHAGEAAQLAIDAAFRKESGVVRPVGREMTIVELWDKLRGFDDSYRANIFPELSDPFDLALFNTYRSGGFPAHCPHELRVSEDDRGILFESAKGGNASHTFLSTTHPGKTRGDHFHISLVERFVVVRGEAVIRVRRVLDEAVHEFRVTGERPVAVDQIPLHTHSLENVGSGDLVTFFWTHRMFDPAQPDTFADPVLPR